MNCQDFETAIIEIARDRLMDAAARERGLEHVQGCARCATLLVEERALSRDLRALSARGSEEIPARIETALLAAYRRQVAASPVAPARASMNRRWLLAAALALITIGLSAAVLSLTGYSVTQWIASSTDRRAPATGSTDGGSVSNPAVAVTPEKSGQPSPEPLPEIAADHRLDLPIPGSTEGKRQKRPTLAGAGRRASGNKIDGLPREYVTEFFPVMQGAELIPLESAQIVRVRMPRSNLISLGIPFNQERVNETVKADVLVSNDGLARAIRLVY